MFARFFDQNGIPIGTIAYINGKPINSSKDIDQPYQLKEELYKSCT
jgi:hypothetical protein